VIPDEVTQWLEINGYGQVTGWQRAAGGCINHGITLTTAGGQSFFVKTNSSAPPDMFEREAEGLLALAVAEGPRVPAAYLYGEQFLLLEDLTPARPGAEYWPELGRRLAELHTNTSPQFGFEHDNYIGSTPQPNPWVEDGWFFFAEHRLIFQVRLAFQNRLLDTGAVRKVERLATRLPELIPEQPASLIHGDLWSGNTISDAQGKPALIDPAAHYGWAEAELGMTKLFGGFPESFYRAYEEIRPLSPGMKARFPIYNLYHLLNHLNLFGAGYHSQVMGILRIYA
jgi:protein-ribulosamine 3-kinase